MESSCNCLERYKFFVWSNCVAVLRCPMSVEDKIQTLESEIKKLSVDAGSHYFAVTGLEPFDKAVSSYVRQQASDPDLR